MSTTRRFLTPMLSALTLSTLIACAPSAEYVAPQLPAVTDNLNACTDEPVPGIPGAYNTALEKYEVARVMAEQRTSAVAKDKCSHDWRDFYTDLRAKIGGSSAEGKPTAEQDGPGLVDRAKGAIDGLIP